MGYANGTNTIQSGDVLQVLYVDTADDAGSSSTQYDSATFDLRTGTLSVDKDVYVMGSDMVITITDPDLNTDSASSQSYTMRHNRMGLFSKDSSRTTTTIYWLHSLQTHQVSRKLVLTLEYSRQ